MQARGNTRLDDIIKAVTIDLNIFYFKAVQKYLKPSRIINDKEDSRFSLLWSDLGYRDETNIQQCRFS